MGSFLPLRTLKKKFKKVDVVVRLGFGAGSFFVVGEVKKLPHHFHIVIGMWRSIVHVGAKKKFFFVKTLNFKHRIITPKKYKKK